MKKLYYLILIFLSRLSGTKFIPHNCCAELVLLATLLTCRLYAGGGVPDTGQSTSYTSTFGEDHDYQPANTQMSYTDNGNGTITDNRTGLMWAKDGSGAGCNNGVTLTWEAALTFCEGLNFAGYTDWRLPNAKELFSIVKFEGPAPFIDTTYFPNTVFYYWTSTTYVPTTTNAMVVYFDPGAVIGVDKTVLCYVRPVRGGP